MAVEGEGRNYKEVMKKALVGAGVLILAFAAANAVLLNTGIYMTSGI